MHLPELDHARPSTFQLLAGGEKFVELRDAVLDDLVVSAVERPLIEDLHMVNSMVAHGK